MTDRMLDLGMRRVFLDVLESRPRELTVIQQSKEILVVQPPQLKQLLDEEITVTPMSLDKNYQEHYNIAIRFGLHKYGVGAFQVESGSGGVWMNAIHAVDQDDGIAISIMVRKGIAPNMLYKKDY